MKKINLKGLLAIVSAFTISAPLALTVVACGPNIVKREPKLDLNNVIEVREVDGNKFNEKSKVFAEVARMNSDLSVEDVTIEDFVKATEVTEGSAQIVAKFNTKYIGRVKITITNLAKNPLADILTIKLISGDVANTSTKAMQEAIKKNDNSQLTDRDVEVESFTPATYNTDGTIIIAAKLNSKYYGSVKITIEKLTKINLETAIKVREVDGFKFNDEVTVLQEIVRLNQESSITEQDVIIKDFKKAMVDNNGSAKIVTNSDRVTGQVDIVINLEYEESWGMDKYIDSANPRIWIHKADVEVLIETGRIDSYIWMLAIWTGLLDTGYNGSEGSYAESKYRFDNQNIDSYLSSSRINDVLFEFLSSKPNGGNLSSELASRIELTLSKDVVAKNLNNNNQLVEYKLQKGAVNFKKLTIVVT